jgi:hypothetical protein
VVLRHQLAILGRGGKRPQYTTVDRAFLAAASRLLPPERWSCFRVSPRTLRRWHRALLEARRRGRRRRPGRTPLAAETRSLIQRLARENPRWGYMRIQGELLKLGISLSRHHDRDRAAQLGPGSGTAADRPQLVCVSARVGCTNSISLQGGRFHSRLRSPLYGADDAEKLRDLVVLTTCARACSRHRRQSRRSRGTAAFIVCRMGDAGRLQQRRPRASRVRNARER